jgi:hypothetical protein
MLLVLCAAFALSVGVATATADGNGTQTFQFKVSYTDFAGFFSDCSGVHLVKKDGSVSDSETCTITGPKQSEFVAGTYTSSVVNGAGCGVIVPAEPGYASSAPGGVSFISDYPGYGKCAASYSATFTQSADGTWTVDYKAYF